MVDSLHEHDLDDLFSWAVGKHLEATKQSGFHGDMTIRVAYANGRVSIVERTISEKYKPAN